MLSIARAARLVEIAAVGVIASCLALGAGGWFLLSLLNQQWEQLVDATDDGLARVEGVLAASTDLASETASGLESVDTAVDSGRTLTEQTAGVTSSVQDVMLPLLDNVDAFAAGLEDLALFVERNEALALLGFDPSIESSELAALRRDLAELEAELSDIDMEGGLAADVDTVSVSLDSVVVELRATERELELSADRVADARADLEAMRDDLGPVIWLARALLSVFLLSIAASQIGLHSLARSLRRGADLGVEARSDDLVLAMSGSD